ncbi:hypothetical protein [Streptomyces sp. Isolate_219]|nr:hypothetical protein [Streptomyces sp. Isolate_219]MCR8574693.1 hypothetical protein [Streptomyces sp. Isolate_219]
MALRKVIPVSELREKRTGQDDEQHGRDYQASRGGWVEREAKPVPGTPK